MSFDIETAIAGAGTHLGNVIRTLHDGVAFRHCGQTFNVFSHEGDELGKLSTADVNFAVCYMKRLGRQVGKCTHPTFTNSQGIHGPLAGEPAFTFAWEGWLMHNGVRV